MTKYILIPLLLFSVKGISQRVDTKDAVSIADSIVRASVSDSLFKYFHISEGSYYSYKDHNDRSRSRIFLTRKKLPNSFERLNFLYHFNYTPMKGISGGAWVILDKNLKQTEKINIDFIPEFLLKNRPPDFLTIDSVLKIARMNFKQTGSFYSPTTPELSYDQIHHYYIYTVYNELNLKISEAEKREFIEINARSGKIVDKGERLNRAIIIR